MELNGSSFSEAYVNADAVFIAFILLMGVITYGALMKTGFRKERGVVAIISAIVGLVTASALYGSRDEPYIFNFFVVLMVLFGLLYVLVPFIRFIIGR